MLISLTLLYRGYNRDSLILSKQECSLVQQCIASGSILKDDFQAPTFTNARVAAKLNGYLDIFKNCCDTKNKKRSTKEEKNLSYRPFEPIGEVSKKHQYSKP